MTTFLLLLASLFPMVSPLPSSAWEQSQWISVSNAPIVTEAVKRETRAADGAAWFVCAISCDKPVRTAVWMTTGLGVYQLYVDTTEVGEEILKPGFTHYAKTRRSFTYDITQAVKDKKAFVLSAQVTPGWWADKIITPDGNPGMYGKKCAFRAVLQLTLEDGSVQVIGTDTEHWRAGVAGPVVHAAVFDGEEYDARVPMGYETPEKLTTPVVNEEFHGEILPTDGAEVYLRRDLALPPQQAYVYSGVTDADAEHFGKVAVSRSWEQADALALHAGDTLVVDFGQNCAAVPEMVFEAAEGVTLTVLPGELLNDSLGAKKRGMDGPEGAVHRSNLRIAETGMRLRYTFAGKDGKETFVPKCTYFGYRFISVTATGDVLIHAIRSVPVSSISSALETGRITTGHPLVNRLILNTMWSQRSNYLSVPTDCPQRDERLGWTADTQVFCETGTYFADTRTFFNKWLRDLRDTQKDNGAYPGVAPYGYCGASDTETARVGWADAGIIVPWTIWKQFGDTDLVKAHWESMERYMDHGAAVRFDHEALIPDNGNYQWADWLSYEPLESYSGKAWDTGGLRSEAAEYWSFLSASYWIIDASMMLDMARATGKDTAKYSQMLSEAKAYAKGRFLHDDGSFRTEVFNTMQTPALFVLRNSLLEGEAKENMIARLRANFLEHNQCLQTGFLGTSVLLPTLTGNGMADVAYDLLFQHRNPGWFYSIDNGATTIWERWDSYTTEKGLASNGMNSFNHYAYGCVCQWLWQTAAGIQSDPAHPGFTHFILAPIPDKRLVSVDASYESAAGLIQSEWHYKGDTCIWNFTIPEGTTATVITGGEKKEYGAGRWQISNPPAEEAGLQQTNYNKCTKRWHDGRLVITTPHGSFDALGQKIKE